MLLSGMPRVIHIPLSGGDRKAQAKQIRWAHGLHNQLMKQSAAARREAELKTREADALECQAWNTIMDCGGPAVPSPTIEQALNAGYDFVIAGCNSCNRTNKADLKRVRRPPGTFLHTLEPSLFCEPCSQGRRYKVRAYIIGVCAGDPNQPKPLEACP